MTVAATRSVTIIGAGFCGTLLSILLARRGIASELYERHPDPRQVERTGLPPDNLSLGARGRHALQLAGLKETVSHLVTPMRGRMIHDRASKTRLQPYGVRAAETLYSISRRRLICCLLDAAEATGNVALHFNCLLENIDWTNCRAAFPDVGERPFEVLIGADGAGSRVRRTMHEAEGVAVEMELLDAGYKPLCIPAATDGRPQLDLHALHVWPRGGYMMVAMPDIDGSFAANLFLPQKGDHRMPWGFAELDSWVRQKAFMNFNFPDATPLLPNLELDFRDNPVGQMGTIRCDRWHVGGKGLLLGDAAHTIVPFHGQGVNAAMEDCTALMEILDAGVDDWESVFNRLQVQRRADANAISDMALDAYRTVRDSVRHREFMLRKALERELELRHPGLFEARYSLVMFHLLPYAEACRRGQVQAGILDDLLTGKTRLDEIDFARADRLVAERLTPVPPDL